LAFFSPEFAIFRETLVSGKVEWNKNLPFLSNEKVVFKYNNKQLIEEIQIFDNNNNHKSASKFFYDDQNQIIRKELLLQGRTVAIHTFDYTKNN
jgi:hypothetical protein